MTRLIMSAGKHTVQYGVSLVELMVSITIGLLIVGGIAIVFANSSNSRSEIERASRQTEYSQYAMQVLSYDLANAGYYAEFDPRSLSAPAAKSTSDPCATATAIVASSSTFLSLHVLGYDNGANLATTTTCLNNPAVLSDVKTGTDVLMVRRVSTCVGGATGCPLQSGAPYFQASQCNTELASTSYKLDTNAANLTLHKKNCSTLADMHRYRTHIYFIANNDNAGDGIPTLKRAELGASGFTIAPLAEGVEKLQIEYGLDTNADGITDDFTADPESYNSCSSKTTPTCIDYWRSVVAVNVHLLTRNTERSTGYTDTKTYGLGFNADGTANVAGPFNDPYKRHVTHATIRLNNPAGRNSTP